MRAALLVLGAAALAACSDNGTICEGNIASVSQTSSTLTASGTWSGGKTYLKLVTGPDQTAVLTPTQDNGTTALFDVKTVPVGQHAAVWALSCAVGSHDDIALSGPTTVLIDSTVAQ